MKESLKLLQDFATDRPVLNEHNTPQNLINLLIDEAYEFQNAQQDFEHGKTNRNHLEAEWADIMAFLLTIAWKLDIDPELALREKVGMNHAQHPAGNYQEGEYHDCRHKSKQEAHDFGLEEIFYGNGHNNGSSNSLNRLKNNTEK